MSKMIIKKARLKELMTELEHRIIYTNNLQDSMLGGISFCLTLGIISCNSLTMLVAIIPATWFLLLSGINASQKYILQQAEIKLLE
jgi:hypothetical protein